ncbi:MAG: ClbS/DfsB family four-helix bundle protein [Dehalococcoidia bacterium]
MNKQELAEITRSSRGALEAELAQLSDEQMLTPGVVDDWSVKDVLAHISAWERMFIDWIDALMRGDKPDRPEFFTDEWTDKVNARVYWAHRTDSLEVVLAEFHAMHEVMMEFIEGLSEEDLFDHARFPWANGREMAPWLRANADEHYDEHREQLEAWRRAQRERKSE